MIDLLVNRGRSLIYATGLPPSVVAAAVASLKIIQTNKKLTNLPILNARRFARRLGLPDADSPIIPIVTKTSKKALESSQKLMDEGFLVTAIRPPTVPEGTARLRFTFSAQHRKEEIDRLAATVLKIGLL